MGFVSGCFAFAWWAFAFPLTFCDSPAWAPAYLSRLLGLHATLEVAARGVLVPAWFQAWGALSLATGAANLIGLVQGAALLSAVLALLMYLRSGMTTAELLVLPAFALTGLRHAIYSQTILSESLLITLAIPVALLILRDKTPSLRQSASMGGLAGLAAGARIENLLLLGFVLARLRLARAPWRERASRLGLALGAGLVVLGALAQLARARRLARQDAARGGVDPLNEPPRNALARASHIELVERLGAATSGASIRDIYGGLLPARRLFAEPDAPGWLEILRWLVYQVANRPLVVFADRAGALADLYASGYAAFWRGYRAWSAYYSPYDQVFARWSADDFQQLRTSCPDFARAQAAHYHRVALRSPGALRLLQALHAGAEPYVRWLLRLLYWAAAPACLALLARGSGGCRTRGSPRCFSASSRCAPR